MTARRASIGQVRAGLNRRTQAIRSAATRAEPSRRSYSPSSWLTPGTRRCPRPSNNQRNDRGEIVMKAIVVTDRAVGTDGMKLAERPQGTAQLLVAMQ